MNNKKRTILIYILLGSGLIALLYPKFFDKKNEPVKSNSTIKKTEVKTLIVKESLTNFDISSTGVLQANEEVTIYPELQGKVVIIGFREGQYVNKGDLLIKLNDKELMAQIKKAEAILALKNQNETRNKILLEKGAISNELYDLSWSEKQTAEAELELLKEQLSKTEIRAPFPGKIGLRKISTGSIINPTIEVTTLQQINLLKLEFTVNEAEAYQLKTGMQISFTTANGKKNIANIYAIDPKVDQTTGTVTIKAYVTNQDGNLLPGSYAQININVEQNRPVVLLPTQAIIPILKGQKVYVVQGDSVIDRKIQTGKRKDAVIEVVNGLVNGDEVVIEGVLYLRAGSKITKRK